MKTSPDNYLLKSAKMEYLQIPSVLKLGTQGMTRESGEGGKGMGGQGPGCPVLLTTL